MNTIKNYFRTLPLRGYINWGIAIVACFAIFRACQSQNKYDELLSKAGTTSLPPETATLKEAEELERQLDTAGRERVVFKLADPIIQKIIDNTKVDSITKIANVEKEKVTSVTLINGELSKENIELRRIISTIAEQSKDTVWWYSDPWLSLSMGRKNDSTFTMKKIWADLSLAKIDHDRKKYWLVGKTENLSTVYFNSPYARVNGMETLRIKQPEPFFDVSVQAEGRYLHTPAQLLIGPRVDIKLGRFSIGTGYSFNPAGKIGNSVWYGGSYRLY